MARRSAARSNFAAARLQTDYPTKTAQASPLAPRHCYLVSAATNATCERAYFWELEFALALFYKFKLFAQIVGAHEFVVRDFVCAAAS